MTILVCPLSRVNELVASHAPARVVSLLDPGSPFPELGPRYAERHLRLSFHDVDAPLVDLRPATVDQAMQLVDFVAAWDRTAPILLHCRAGISRSTAAAFITACLANPETPEYDIAVQLRRVAPQARPNEALVRLADGVMGREGRMSEAIDRTGRHLSWIEIGEAEPFALSLS